MREKIIKLFQYCICCNLKKGLRISKRKQSFFPGATGKRIGIGGQEERTKVCQVRGADRKRVGNN